MTAMQNRACSAGAPVRPVRIVASHDPLRNVPRGNFTLDDYSYDDSDLCHSDFGNCRMDSKGLA